METDVYSKDEVAERENEDGNVKHKNTKICESDTKNGDESVIELQFRFKDLPGDNGKHDIRSNDVSNLNI